jgi:hypothetical protein
MRIKALLGHSSAVLSLFLLLAGGAWAQTLPQPCDGALIPQGELGPLALGNATGCGVIITVTAVDDSGNATAFTISAPGNGNPYDGPPFSVEGDNSDDTLVGIINNSTGSLSSITLTSTNTTFGGAFAFSGDGPCEYALELYNFNNCLPSQAGYEGPDNSFGSCGDGGPCSTTDTVFFTTPLGHGASTWFALEGTPASLNLAQQVILTFNPGTNSSAIATFNCSTPTPPACPDQGAHSMKFTVANVTSQFSITLVATEVDGDGVCDSGTPGDPSDPIDCRFVTFFGEPTSTLAVNVPRCYAYSSASTSGPFHCVFYSVQGAPPQPPPTGSLSPYTGPVLEAIAWNTLATPGAGFVSSPRMYDDPSDDLNICNCYPTIPGFPYSPEDNQFVFDITTFFNPSPNTVGTDPTTGGKTQTFNDFVIAFPRTIAQIQQPINSDGSSVFNAKRGVVPIKFNLLKDGVATCNLPPATLSLNRLTVGAVGIVTESTYIMAADSGSNFRISGCQYIYNLAASGLGVGQYKVGLMIGSEVVGIAYLELK